MTVPEAPMHEKDSAELAKNYVGLARKVGHMRPIAESTGV